MHLQTSDSNDFCKSIVKVSYFRRASADYCLIPHFRSIRTGYQYDMRCGGGETNVNNFRLKRIICV